MKKFTLAIMTSCLLQGTAQAATVDTNMTVDNSFNYYISTDDAVEGVLVGTGNSWMDTFAFSATLTPGVTNYLHIKGVDVGVISAFIGQFAVSDSGFVFANGSQNLLTNTQDWRVNLTGFNNPYVAPVALGANNGANIWGVRPQISAAAQFIWDPSGCTNCTAYFSTTVSAVPEPNSLVMLVIGMGLAGFATRKLRNHTAA